jgi:hypothetical protein
LNTIYWFKYFEYKNIYNINIYATSCFLMEGYIWDWEVRSGEDESLKRLTPDNARDVGFKYISRFHA